MCHLPASAETVAGFLAASAKEGMKASTIGRRCSAIRYAHKLAGFANPADDERVKAVVRGIRRTIGTARASKAPATADLVLAMLKCCDGSLKGKRDAALLALGFAGAFRRSELVALTVADLTEVPDGLRVTIRRSKGDQEGVGQAVAIPRGYRIRPVERVQAWLAAAGISEGPVFRQVAKGGRVGARGLTVGAAGGIVKRLAEQAGCDPRLFAAHSLRSGFLTSAAEAGASVFKMADQSRHRSLDTLRGYVRSADMFKEHAGAAFL